MIAKILLKFDWLRKFKPLTRLAIKQCSEPSFFIVGFQKCGTTTLYDLLCEHPNVVKGLMKENNLLAGKRDRVEEFKLCFPKKRKGKITGDASHLHTWKPFGLERIKKNFPNAKIIVIMREPVARAYSHFNMDQKTGYFPNKISFQQAISIEETLRESIEKEFDIADTYNSTKLFGNKYGWPLSRGIYANYISKIKELNFNFLHLFMEDLANNQEETMNRVQDFLDLERISFPKQVKNQGKYASKISEDLEVKLKKFYEPHNQRLKELLNEELPWKY